jgi:hypothetical protein
LVGFNFAAIAFWLLGWTMLSAFSYIPFWASSIILSASAIVAWFFGFIFKQDFLNQPIWSKVIRIVIIVLALAFCWVVPALVRDVCVTFQPVTFTFRAGRTDPCCTFPIHILTH